MHKVAIFSIALPPRPSGQAVMLRRLLAPIDPAKYVLLSSINYHGSIGALPAQFYYISIDSSISAQEKIAVMSKLILQVIEKEHCTAIVVCTADLLSPPACHLASCLADIPFYLYAFDDYTRQWCESSKRQIAENYLPRMAQDARAVIVPNELLRDEYQQRFNINPVVIHNPPAISQNHVAKESVSSNHELNIAYTGEIYDAHYDAVYNLIAAAEAIHSLKVSLHLYSAQKEPWLKEHGVVGPVVCHPYLSGAKLVEAYQNADLLFLPLAFNSPYPEGLIATSSPGKMGDYLWSGKPILVHAPSDSFIVQYFKKHHCGFVVDINDPLALVGALLASRNAPALWENVLQNAAECAKRDFNLGVIQKQFVDLLFKDLDK